MCKLLIGIKVNNLEDNRFEKIIRAQEESMSNQPHGIGALIIDRYNRISLKRELNKYEKVFNWVRNRIKDAKIVVIHTRQATDGKIDEKNIHLFNSGGYFFAHNGIVSKFSKYGGSGFIQVGMGTRGLPYPASKRFFIPDSDIISEEPKDVEKALEMEKEIEKKSDEMCDSYKFLVSLKKPITKLGLIQDIEDKGFMGMGVLVGERDKKITVFSTRIFEAHTDFKNYTIVYSYEPTNTMLYYKNALGFPIIFKEKSGKLKPLPVASGVYEINYGKLKVGKK